LSAGLNFNLGANIERLSNEEKRIYTAHLLCCELLAAPRRSGRSSGHYYVLPAFYDKEYGKGETPWKNPHPARKPSLLSTKKELMEAYQNAVKQLEEKSKAELRPQAIVEAKKKTETLQKADELSLEAVIQRFEYTYELCWKMLKRRIELDSPNPAAVDAMSFKDLLRDGAERGLIEDVEKWMIYRDQRNITARTYDEQKAASVHRTAALLRDAFSESDLPFKVDVVDWAEISESFRKVIEEKNEIF